MPRCRRSWHRGRRRRRATSYRLQRALDRACEIATPITAEQQAAREQLWTPGDDEKTEPAVAKPTIWTPGQPR